MNWYKTNFDGVEQQVKQNEEARNNKTPRRLWIPQNTTKEVIYLDEEGFTFYEHAIEHGGRFDNFFTCLGRAAGCPICASGKKPYLITVFTIIDMSEYTDKQGVKHANEKRIHALKSESALSLQRKIQRWGGIKGKQVVLTRKGGKDASSGSDFELAMRDGKIISYKLNSTDEKYKAYDYRVLFAPRTPEQIREELGLVAHDNAMAQGIPVGSSSGFQSGGNSGSSLPPGLTPEDAPSSGASEDDDVPF